MNPESSAVKTATRCFLISASVMLLVTAASKALLAVGGERPLASPDPFFDFLPVRLVLTIASVLEIGVFVLLASGTREETKLGALLWLSALFGGYRAAGWLLAGNAACGCLGRMPELVGLTQRQANAVSLVLLCYLSVGSLVLLVANLATSSRCRGEPGPRDGRTDPGLGAAPSPAGKPKHNHL